MRLRASAGIKLRVNSAESRKLLPLFSREERESGKGVRGKR